MITPGTYRARCTGERDVQFGYAQTGTEQIAVLFELLNEGQPTGTRITWFGSFASAESTKIALKALENCGWNGENVTDLRGVEANEVELVIEEEIDQAGKTRTKVRWVNRPGEGGRVTLKKQMNAGEKMAFAQRIKGQILAERQSSGTRPAVKTTVDDSDIPF